MYVIIVTMVVIVLMGVAYCYFWWRRKLVRQHEAHQSQHEPNVQRHVFSDDHYDHNLLQTPTQQSSASFVEASTLPIITASAINSGIPLIMWPISVGIVNFQQKNVETSWRSNHWKTEAGKLDSLSNGMWRASVAEVDTIWRIRGPRSEHITSCRTHLDISAKHAYTITNKLPL